MSAFDRIFGNRETVASLRTAVSSGRAAASYVIAGPEMSGKYTLALEFACALTEKLSAENADVLCKKIRTGISPDVTVCGLGDKRSIGVEDIRGIFGAAYTTPNELEFRMFIIRDAHKLTAQAQNALLKVFEEPPEHAYIFLLCESRAKLLATLVSRAQNIDTEVFDAEDMKRFFQGRYDVEGERAEIAFLLSGGALGKAEKLLSDDEGVDDYRAAVEILETFKKNDGYLSLDLCLKACQTRESCDAILSLLTDAVGDILSAACNNGARPRFFRSTSDAGAFALKTDAARLVKLGERLSEIRDNLDLNAGAASSATAAFIGLKRCFE